MRGLVTAALLLALFAAGVGIGRASAPSKKTSEPRWSVAGDLARPRAYARAVALVTGEILVVGGLDPADDHVTIATSELFDPATGRDTVLPQRLLGRLNQSLAVLNGGSVLVTGGTEWLKNEWNSVAKVDVYFPWTRTWVDAAPMRDERSDHGIATLRDGRVLVAGGNRNAAILASAEIYDPVANAWIRSAPLPAPRTQLSLAALPDGTILAAGGFDGMGKLATSTYLYEPWADRWIEGPELRAPRLNHSMVQLPSGDLLFFGGEGMGAESAERYSWRERRFVYAGVLGAPRLVAQGAVLPNGAVVMVGGLPEDRDRTRFAPLAAAELWDPDDGIWRDIAAAPSERAYAQLVSTPRGLYRISGVGDDERPFASVEQLRWE